MIRHNLINPENSGAPNYNVADKVSSFCIYVSPREEVCIVNEVDNNYISWCSLTHISDEETNADIINYLLGPFERMYSSEYRALGRRYSEVKEWHKLRINSEFYKDNEFRYRSPVSNCFFGDSSYNNGSLLANEINKFYRIELSKCQYRLVDEVYMNVLRRYKSILMKEMSPEYYHQMLPVIAILKSEGYLKLCLNEEVRHLYLESLEICSSLYNTYMSHAR